MGKYAVFLEGNNFELTLEGRKSLFGFFKTVRVESPSEQEAKDSAISLLRFEPELQEALKHAAATKPSIEATVVHELEPENMMKNTGFTFFPMEDE